MTQTQSRLVFPGFPCEAGAWSKFLPNDRANIIVPFTTVLETSPQIDFNVFAKFVAEKIQNHQPTTIVAHDLGGPVTLLALQRLKKKGSLPKAKLVLFNTTYSRFDVFENPHPFAMQLATYKILKSLAPRMGTEVDPAYQKLMPSIRKLYRRIILGSLLSKVGLRKKSPKLDLGLESLFIRSNDDPYMSSKSLSDLEDVLAPVKTIQIDYGHFPHSSQRIPEIRDQLIRFEG